MSRIKGQINAIEKALDEDEDWKYPEIRGKVVDFITHSIEDGTLYVSIRFQDKT